jgi:hypothetical protein
MSASNSFLCNPKINAAEPKRFLAAMLTPCEQDDPKQTKLDPFEIARSWASNQSIRSQTKIRQNRQNAAI